MLTRVSVEYYARMERGDLSGVSPEVLDSLSQALRLDEADSAHLHDLARAAGPRPPRRRKRPGEQTVRPSLRRFLEAITGAPVWIRDRRMNIVTANPLGRALYAPIIDDPTSGGNTARFMFLNPEAEEFFPEWDRGADEIAGTLRMYAGQSPHDKPLTDLIGELVTRSDEFRIRWAGHNVRFHRLGVNASITLSWATSSWTTRRWTCPRTRTGSCSRTPPSRAVRLPSVCNCWAVSPLPTRPHRTRPVSSGSTHTTATDRERAYCQFLPLPRRRT